jgi:hypothetical protein
MLDLRPGNVAGLTRAAYLRELHGDLPGALELTQMAYDATPYQEFQDRAWLLMQRAHLHLIAGNLDQAETFTRGALELFPNYQSPSELSARSAWRRRSLRKRLNSLKSATPPRATPRTSTRWPRR